MSATLGAAARCHFVDETMPSAAAAEDAPYPLLTVKTDGQPPDRTPVAPWGYDKQVCVELAGDADDPRAVVERAVAAARAGARVLVIRNLVKDCIATHRQLEELAPDLALNVAGEPVPHHSRYHASDRRLLDEAVERAFGRKGAGGVIAVTTQTVEQSLDIDADLLITDLCPMDVLLQRVGRLHRHRDRERPPGFETATAVVLVGEEELVEYADDHGPHGWATVYEHLIILEATRRLIESTPNWSIPTMNRLLVERATHPERLAAIAEEDARWQTHTDKVWAANFVRKKTAELGLLPRSTKPYVEAPFDDETVPDRIRTRLGEDSRRVLFDDQPRSPFGNRVGSFDISERFTRGVPRDIEKATDVSPRKGGGFEFSFGPRQFHYDRLGLRVGESEEGGDE